MMQMAKYLVDNKAAITTRLKEMKKPTLSKLELEKERLYISLEGLSLSEKLATYGQISDVRMRIEKLSKLSEMIENYIRIARKLSCEFDIAIAKELFSCFFIKGFEVNIAVSPVNDLIRRLMPQQSIMHSFDKEVFHLFKWKTLRFNLYFQ
jgi:hypothetical protein